MSADVALPPRGSRIVVAMSGGVDSSVSAALLVRQGYDVVGITIKTHSWEDVGGNPDNDSSCCSLDGINDARAVAAQLHFPHYVLDFSARFKREVIDPFIGEYLAGRTPNPCVLCNRSIKWDELLQNASALGATHMATGHYARVCRDDGTGRYWISRGADHSKDQSYALWALTQESLARTVFPLGGMTKQEVRSQAASLGLPTAAKGESFEICFIPDNNYERFLKEQVSDLTEHVEDGSILLDGKEIGRHHGYPFYTIGQRRGVGVATGEPLYVNRIEKERNHVHVGTLQSLEKRVFTVRDVNLMKYARPSDGLRVDARIRYKDSGGPATLKCLAGGRAEVVCDTARRAITPGQSAVLYEGGDLVGGGIIDEVIA